MASVDLAVPSMEPSVEPMSVEITSSKKAEKDIFDAKRARRRPSNQTIALQKVQSTISRPPMNHMIHCTVSGPSAKTKSSNSKNAKVKKSVPSKSLSEEEALEKYTYRLKMLNPTSFQVFDQKWISMYDPKFRDSFETDNGSTTEPQPGNFKSVPWVQCLQQVCAEYGFSPIGVVPHNSSKPVAPRDSSKVVPSDLRNFDILRYVVPEDMLGKYKSQESKYAASFEGTRVAVTSKENSVFLFTAEDCKSSSEWRNLKQHS